MPRYAENRYAGALPQFDAAFDASCVQRAFSLLPTLDECMKRNGTISRGRWLEGRHLDPTIYTGLGGIAYTYFRVGEHCAAHPEHGNAIEYFTKAQRVAEVCCAARFGDEVSFFCGRVGLQALRCVLSARLGDAQAATLRAEVLALAPAAARHAEDELLFGKAGYLFCVLWLRKTLGPADGDQAALEHVAEALVRAGRTRGGLQWQCFDEPYLGAAHGTVGILLMLLHCHAALAPESQALVQQAFAQLAALRFPSGNVPIILHDRSDEHVHWCHGASGLPALFAKAHELQLPGAKAMAKEAGDVVWQRGLVLKGNGLCHGIAGNAYSFLTLYRLTEDQNCVQQARAFAACLSDEQVQDQVRKQPDRQRACPGQPDAPQSLMEGLAGEVCFLLDLQDPMKARFPGWEL